MSSPIFAAAADAWKATHRDWMLLLESQYERAERDCRGHLLNRAGREEQVSAFSLFYGTAARAQKYASEELLDWWAVHPRVPFATFERQSAAAAAHVECPNCGTAVAS